MAFKRQIENELAAWQKKKAPKPLLLLGARQVGKTWLLKEFGKTHFEDVAYFNFEEQQDLKEFFETDKDPERILQKLSIAQGKPILAGKTLLIFDEIQACPAALTSLKYFYEKAPRFHVAAAGSLLGIELGKPTSFPVGKVEFLEVFPLSFSEFLESAEPVLHDFIGGISQTKAIPQLFHNRLIEQFRYYLVCGGMPEAASAMLNGNDTTVVDKIQNQILTSYLMDFAKHPLTTEMARISYVWNSIPSQLAKENKKFLYQLIKSGARAREYEDAIEWLAKAGLVHKITRCNEPRIPIMAYDDLQSFKLYLFDVGLLRSMAKLDAGILISGDKLFTEFKGSIAENYVLQSLITNGISPLRYWMSEGRAEVDFLFQYKNHIIPVEVKSSENIRSKSLTFYAQKFAPPVRIRYSLANLGIKDGLLNIPLYLTDRTEEMLRIVVANTKP